MNTVINKIKGKIGLKAECVLETDEERQVVWKALNALETQEKYKRHDLRKNPNDLPTKDGEYLIYFEFGDEIRSAVREYICQEKEFSCAVVPIAWRYIEPLEEVEE